MDEAIKGIVGKRIAGVVAKEGQGPRSQVFFVFDDQTHYELYADSEINGTKGLDKGGMDKVRAYCTPPQRNILESDDWVCIAKECREQINSNEAILKDFKSIFVYVFFSDKFPIEKNSSMDVSLLRLSHQALIRLNKGFKESYLFVFVEDTANGGAAKSALAGYGFPDAQAIAIDTDEYHDDEMFCENAGCEISKWIKTYHPGAIAYFPSTEDSMIESWWSGIEAVEDEFPWPFAISKYADILPGDFVSTSETWLTIIKNVLGLMEPSTKLDENRLSIYAATLCEWLHGFEGASGNSYNLFESGSACDTLNIDDFQLGYLLACSSDKHASDVVEEECDVFIQADALKILTSCEQLIMRDALANFFGGDTGLFWALHNTIWPNFEQPLAEEYNDIVNLRSPSPELGGCLEAWTFVVDGWVDCADS